ncbi:unnamed protein product [Rhizoctonia solani]|uniref:Uncharacterized protein n=1 Tax=Rhizoctonia solani TaxID=456999 RepID=A0A8H3D9B0_9AGAM|nr:unnamed protein product [Rhizoctonia solani]
MRGISKAFARTPHMMTAKIGMSKNFLEITPCGANMAGVIIASFWILKQANGLKKLPSELRAPPSPPWVHAQPVWSEKNIVSV